MVNASNYTDTTDTDFKAGSYNIDTGKPLSSTGVRAALHTKEKIANKQVSSADATADTLTANSSDSYYPTAKLAGKNLDALRNGKQDKLAAGIAKNIVAYSGTAGTPGTLTRTTTIDTAANASDDRIPTEKAVATALSGNENTSNKATSITAANKNDVVKYPTIGAVTAWATTTLMDLLLPIGTIIAMETMAYYNNADATFKSKWKVCDGSSSNAPNLKHRFLRGFESGDSTTGGANSVEVDVPLKKHSHTFTGATASGSLNLYHYGDGLDRTIFTNSGDSSTSLPNNNGETTGEGINFSLTPSGTISSEGADSSTITVSTLPSYYTVIYIMKIA
ncbi:MAG: hypothetical protein LBJ25_02560 [Candidatus Margulisbacteria bacterium]|jgi:hypothetical protein|nr:hypothetical protein [Candidatus Margulisiibacteriota bacterium]